MSKALQGYIFSRSFHGNFTPQRVQNLVIRDYVETRGWSFILSATEYGFENSFMILDAMVREKAFDGIVFYSLYLLPEGPQKRRSLFEDMIDAGKEVHFALERLTVTQLSDTKLIEDILLTNNLVDMNKAATNDLIS